MKDGRDLEIKSQMKFNGNKWTGRNVQKQRPGLFSSTEPKGKQYVEKHLDSTS